MNKKNVTDAFILFMVAWIFGYLVISGLPFAIHPALALGCAFVFVVFDLWAIYILVRGLFSHGQWTHYFFLNLRLRSRAKQWYICIDQIRLSQDYGMCCSEEMAIECAKHNVFDELYEYADKYTPDGIKEKEGK